MAALAGAGIDDQVVRDTLTFANTANLMSYLEWCKSQSLTICGVDILSPLAYDIIQVMNHNFLSEYLEGKKPVDA